MGRREYRFALDEILTILAAAALLSVSATGRQALPIMTAGQPAQLDIRAAGPHSLRVTLSADSFRGLPGHASRGGSNLASAGHQPAVAGGTSRASRRALPRRRRASPERSRGPRRFASPCATPPAARSRTLRFEPDGPLSFDVGDGPVLGMGEGGPRPVRGTNWREQPVQFDRRGALDTMEPRWQADMCGSRNPAAVLFGTSGWGLFVATPWVQVDLTDASRGKFLPVQPPATGPQNEKNQQQNAGKGLPPADQYVAGLYDVFVFDAAAPTDALGDFASITGRASMPPRWALGYMQSHRTLEDETQMLRIIDAFREKRIPLDAVIYLGTGFAPVGWNTRQPSFDFNPNVFKRDPKACWPTCTPATSRSSSTWSPGIGIACRRCTERFPPRREKPWTAPTFSRTGSSTLASCAPASMRSGPTKGTGSISSSASSVISSITRVAQHDAERQALGACSAMGFRASPSGAAGSGRATPTRRGRRSRRRSPSA